MKQGNCRVAFEKGQSIINFKYYYVAYVSRVERDVGSFMIECGCGMLFQRMNDRQLYCWLKCTWSGELVNWCVMEIA